MSAIDDLRSVFSTNDSSSSTSRKPLREPSLPPLISAEQQWLSSVSVPATSRRASTNTDSSGVISLQPQTPSQLDAQKRLRLMQEEIREVIGMMRMNFEKCIEPDRHLSELYHLGPDYNPNWKCVRPKGDAGKKKRFWKRVCCLFAILLVIILVFVGDYYVSRWVIQQEIQSELTESMLAKQELENRKTNDWSQSVEKDVTTPPSKEPIQSSSKLVLEENKSKSEQKEVKESVATEADTQVQSDEIQTETLSEATETQAPVPAETEGIETPEQVDESQSNVDENSQEAITEQDQFASLQGAETGNEFPRGHDVLDLALVDAVTLPDSHAAVLKEALWRPTDESDIQQEELSASNGDA